MGKKPQPVGTRHGNMGAQPQTRSNTIPGIANSLPSPSELSYTQPDLVNSAKGGQAFLENRLLLVPEGAPVTMVSLSAALFQIAAIPKVPREAIQAIRSVTWLLDEIEEDAVALTAREAVNTQLGYMNKELRTITDHFQTTLSSEVKKQLKLMSSTVKTMEDKIKQATPYRDTILGHNRALEGTDPKIVA